MSDKHESHNKKFYKPDDKPQADAEGERWTFILPFVVLALLSLPSLVVLAYGKQTIAFDLLEISGMYSLIMAVLWIMIPLALISGVLYLIRGSSRPAKAVVAILSVVLLACFTYIVWPQ